MKHWMRDHGLLLANLALFLFSFVGMVLSGVLHYNEEQLTHGEPTVTPAGFLATGDFLEATFENWESEFLQMGMYVVLTAYLFQRGSSESKLPDKHEPQDDDPQDAAGDKDAPWPVRRGGLALTLYEHSLSILFFALFAASFLLHAVGGSEAYNDEQASHGQPGVSVLGYLATSRFWFESFQNWQSEFMVIAVMVGASVYLRERGSVESKPVAMAHSDTDT
ncbi:DUF6766 family protein [Arthrobacter sp. TmT3-37]|uniref:Transmembrane protein n=1 Tax=Arthrobacter agilis TaxID=37921 RepID=A0A2L0UAP2_9MICC|nr:DUF6766 family protein [Arthrobacter agilis]AUZ86299.1 hypothetical protein CVO76_00540 [Arthrobacter agilis]